MPTSSHPPSKVPPHLPTHPPPNHLCTHPPTLLPPPPPHRPPARMRNLSLIHPTPLPSRPPQAAFKQVSWMQVPPLPPHHYQHPPSQPPPPSPAQPHHTPIHTSPSLIHRPPPVHTSLLTCRGSSPALTPRPLPTPTPTPHHYTPPPPSTPHPPSPTPRHRASKHLTPSFSQAMLLWYAMGAIGRPLKCDSSWWRED